MRVFLLKEDLLNKDEKLLMSWLFRPLFQLAYSNMKQKAVNIIKKTFNIQFVPLFSSHKLITLPIIEWTKQRLNGFQGLAR